MRIRISTLLMAGCLLSWGACQRGTVPAGDRFLLTMDRIINDSDILVSVLKIRVPVEAAISVDGEHFHSMIVLPNWPVGKVREGQVALSASRFTCQGDRLASIQTLMRPESSDGEFAGGPTVYHVPIATKLNAFFSVSATNGEYKLDSPIEIADWVGSL